MTRAVAALRSGELAVIEPPPGATDYGTHTVYQLDCPRCGAYYYGVTKGSVGKRLKEHRKDGSAPAKHEVDCGSSVRYKDLARYDDRAVAEGYETRLIRDAWKDPLCLNEQISNKRRKRRGR